MKCKLSAFINNTIVYMDYEQKCTNALLACSKLEHTFKYTIKREYKFSILKALLFVEKNIGVST